MKIIPSFNNRDLEKEADEIRIKIYDLLREISPDKLELEEEELLHLYNAIFDDEDYEIEDNENEEDENNDNEYNFDLDNYYILNVKFEMERTKNGFIF